MFVNWLSDRLLTNHHNTFLRAHLLDDSTNVFLLLVIEQFIRWVMFSGSECQVNPQFYAFRWITLLLTQEFNFADSLHIWDTLLSDPDGPQVQFIFNLVL